MSRGSPADGHLGSAPPPADFEFIDDPVRLEEITDTLANISGELAVDVERASGIRYSDRAFLVQVRARTGPAYLVDPETLGRTIGPLAELLSSRPLLFHAASQDLPSLSELGVTASTLVDTELAGRFLGIPRVNLGAMISENLGIALSKAHSAADWSRRPLPSSWLSYAAYDVQFLHELADAVLKQLDKSGRRPWFDFECQYIASTPAAPPPEQPWRRLARLSSLRGGRQLARARALWTARDEVAREKDIAPKRLLADAAIIAAASQNPGTTDTILGIDGFSGPHRARLASRWIAALNEANALDEPDLPDRHGPSGVHPPHSSWKRNEPRAAQLLALVREAMEKLAEPWSIEPALLLRPSTMRLWVWTAATTPYCDDAESIREILARDGAREWQIELCTPVLQRALQELHTSE